MPCRIENRLTPGAIEQANTEGLFQVANLRTDRRLRQADAHACGGERAVARHRDEGFQFPKHDGHRLIEKI
ncbi:hypothetical protein D3C84_759330 [compost metagenome]